MIATLTDTERAVLYIVGYSQVTLSDMPQTLCSLGQHGVVEFSQRKFGITPDECRNSDKTVAELLRRGLLALMSSEWRSKAVSQSLICVFPQWCLYQLLENYRYLSQVKLSGT